MPQRRKAPDRRQNRGTADLGLVAVAASSAPPVPHPTGRKLLAETARAWESFWSSELASLVTDADRPALVRLFSMYDLRARYERLVLKEPMVAGSMKQARVNPAATEMASLDGRIAALEDRFGLTPLARLKLGVTFGAARKSLEGMNRDFDADETGDEDDPRLRAIDVDAIEG